jgi:hypothetical protein
MIQLFTALVLTLSASADARSIKSVEPASIPALAKCTILDAVLEEGQKSEVQIHAGAEEDAVLETKYFRLQLMAEPSATSNFALELAHLDAKDGSAGVSVRAGRVNQGPEIRFMLSTKINRGTPEEQSTRAQVSCKLSPPKLIKIGE